MRCNMFFVYRDLNVETLCRWTAGFKGSYMLCKQNVQEKQHCTTCWKFVGSIPDGVIGIFHWHNRCGHTVALELIQTVTEMSTRNISRGTKVASAWGWQTYNLHMPIVMKSGNLNLMEPSGPVQACNRGWRKTGKANSHIQCLLTGLCRGSAVHGGIWPHAWGMDLSLKWFTGLSKGFLQTIFNADLQHIPQVSSLTTRWLTRAGNDNYLHFIFDICGVSVNAKGGRSSNIWAFATIEEVLPQQNSQSVSSSLIRTTEGHIIICSLTSNRQTGNTVRLNRTHFRLNWRTLSCNGI